MAEQAVRFQERLLETFVIIKRELHQRVNSLFRIDGEFFDGSSRERDEFTYLFNAEFNGFLIGLQEFVRRLCEFNGLRHARARLLQ